MRRTPAGLAALLATALLATTTLVAGTALAAGKPGDERVRLNRWLFNGAAPTNGLPAEVVVESFAFQP